VDDDFRDTVTYTLKQRFIFRPDLSNGLTGNEEVVFPNLITFASIMTVKKEREAFLPIIIKANQQMFGNNTSPFKRIRIMDILFDGMVFNCSGSDFAIRTACAAIKAEGERQGVRIVNNTHLSISLLGHVSICKVVKMCSVTH
jgi:scavenger receptor class B protein 1